MKKTYFIGILYCLFSMQYATGQQQGNLLFDNSTIHEIIILPFFENLLDTLENNYRFSFGMNQIQTRDIPYTPVKIIMDGTILDTVAIRHKGFNSWWHSVKKPIKIDLNKYQPGQEYDGLKKFNLHNGSGDPSFIRENIDYKILRLLDIPAPRTSFAKVFIDTAYIGLYRIVEQIDNTFLDIHFYNHNGHLYKQQAKGTAGFSLDWRGKNQEVYYESVSLENHQKQNDWTGFVHFLDVLNNTSDKNFRDSILTVFNVDGFLQVLAFDITVNNLDYYGNSGRNYYLYDNNGIFHWIPWDYNLTWREGAPSIDITPGDFPILVRRLMLVPEFKKLFMTKYCQVNSYLTEPFVDNLVAEETSLIAGFMENDPYMDYPFEAFQTNINSSWMRIPGLKPFAAQRHLEISSTLESLQIDCNANGNSIFPDNNLLQLYPVPADNWVKIGLFPNKEINVSIFNTFGQVVLRSIILEKGNIDISALNSGCYVIRAKVDAKDYTRLLLVKHD